MLNALFGVAYKLEMPFFPSRSLNVSTPGWRMKAAPALPAVSPVPAKRCGTQRQGCRWAELLPALRLVQHPPLIVAVYSNPDGGLE
jgi:hypothetical protein